MSSKRVSVKDKMKQDSLFNPTVEVMQDQVHIDDKKTNNNVIEQTSNIVNSKIKKQDYKRQTYFLSDDLIQAIAFKSVFDKMDKSEIVREALKSYIEDRYFNMK